MLDPGHGGKDPGALGEGGVSEKDVVLVISKRLGRKLVERLPVDILFTRTEDVFVPLEERIARANAAKADLFVSIHANASINPELQGIETYYLNNTDDRATIRLAALENGLRPEQSSRNDIEGAGLSYVLSDLIQTGKEEESIALAHYLQEAVVTRARERYPTVQNLGVKKGPFYVLVGAHMPCVLVETAFISHPVEGKRLMSVEYQEALAEGLFLGIARFLRAEVMTKSL
jgi:N-acetylmuramoyl-L-alanine amidase